MLTSLCFDSNCALVLLSWNKKYVPCYFSFLLYRSAQWGGFGPSKRLGFLDFGYFKEIELLKTVVTMCSIFNMMSWEQIRKSSLQFNIDMYVCQVDRGQPC